MRTRLVVVVVFAAAPACRSAPPDPGPAGGGDAVTCAARADNALRADCHVALAEPGPVELVYTSDEETVVIASTATASAHDLVLWGLAPDTTYTVTAGDARTTFATGALPEPLARVVVETTGAPDDLEALVGPVVCGAEAFLVVFDPTGRVRWYERADAPGPFDAIEGFAVTEGPAFLALVAGAVREWTVTGDTRLALDPGTHFDRLVHHDVARVGDLTLALFAERVTAPDGEEYVVDGVYAFDAAGAIVEEWHLADHVDPAWYGETAPPGFGFGGDGPIDWSHANSVTGADDGDWILSLRWLDAVVRVDAPTGALDWILTGTDRSPLPPDFAWDAVDGVVPGFVGQHHATLRDGRLTLFDNRVAPEPSRALVIALDEAAGVATAVEAHAVGETCDVQGGAAPLPGGGVLATCATSGRVSEFPPGAGDQPSFTFRATCDAPSTGGPVVVGGVARFLPFDLP